MTYYDPSKYFEYRVGDITYEYIDTLNGLELIIFYANQYRIWVLAASVLLAIFSAMLIFAIKEGTKWMFWPWIIYMAMELSGGIIVCIMCFISEELVVRIAGMCLVLFWTFHAYMLHCVVSYYNKMNETVQYQKLMQGYVVRPTQPMQYAEPVKIPYPAPLVPGRPSSVVSSQSTISQPQAELQAVDQQPDLPTVHQQKQPEEPLPKY